MATLTRSNSNKSITSATSEPSSEFLAKTSSVPSIQIHYPTSRRPNFTTKDSVQPLDLETFGKLVDDGSQSTLIIDIRPYNLYVKSRIRNAINICIPTTLLKRDSFKLANILDSISEDSRDILAEKLKVNTLKIVIYDSNSSLNNINHSLHQSCLKFVKLNSNDTCYSVFYLNGGMTPLLGSISPTKHKYIDNEPIEITNKNSVEFCLNSSPSSPVKSRSLGTSPLLTGFSLPKQTPFQNVFANSLTKKVPSLSVSTNVEEFASYDYDLKIPQNFTEVDKLPNWLKFMMENKDNKKEIFKIINNKFLRIENTENLRLQKIANFSSGSVSASASSQPSPFPSASIMNHNPTLCSPSALCPACDSTTYSLPKGIEQGLKNRYSNIWPYEHSRVKILQSPHTNSPNTLNSGPFSHSNSSTSLLSPIPGRERDDYFNANYVNYGQISNFNYIATQNPMVSTFEDFWKIVWYNDISVITSLNHDLNPQQYYDDNCYPNGLSTRIIKYEETVNGVQIRQIELKKKDEVRVVHLLKFLEWPDFGVPPSIDNLMELIGVKNRLCGEKNLSVIHCSAGCGRTGCFITVDMILNCFKTFEKVGSCDRCQILDPWGDDDIIYKTVQELRKQRISMVQNLNQFIICYEIILNYIVRQLS